MKLVILEKHKTLLTPTKDSQVFTATIVGLPVKSDKLGLMGEDGVVIPAGVELANKETELVVGEVIEFNIDGEVTQRTAPAPVPQRRSGKSTPAHRTENSM